jgi:hypothetical protein
MFPLKKMNDQSLFEASKCECKSILTDLFPECQRKSIDTKKPAVYDRDTLQGGEAGGYWDQNEKCAESCAADPGASSAGAWGQQTNHIELGKQQNIPRYRERCEAERPVQDQSRPSFEGGKAYVKLFGLSG